VEATTGGHLDVDGARLEYRWWGDRSEPGPVLVLLHEGLGCVELWRDLPELALRATGLPVFAYSRQGYGRSSPCELPRTPRYMHHEALTVLPRVLEAARIADPVLIGHSDGASIGIVYAGAVAGPLRALVTLAAHVYVEQVGLDHIASMRADREARDDLLERLGKYHDDPAATFAGWNDIWLHPAFRWWDIREYLPGITCPTLVVQGRDDPFATMAMVEELVAGVSGPVEAMVINDCGHVIHQDQPELLVQALADFMGDLR
jgi:pimeloyl-ACP methyl ester carboxylesterase